MTYPEGVTRPAFSPSAPFLIALAVLLALAHAVLALTALTEKSLTADEIAYLTAGRVYNQLGDYRLQPENGNLPQRWAALPLTLGHAPLPPVSLESWPRADVWNYGHVFFYEQGLSSEEFIFLGRGMMALFSAATGLLVFFWSRALFGWRGAFLSLVLYVFCPSFLGHGALATSDVIMTFFFLAATGAWWRHLEKPGTGRAALSATVLGLACVTKFSAVLLLPMFALMAVVWLGGHGRPGERLAALGRLGRIVVAHGIVAWAIIWVFYGFRFSAFAPAYAAGAGFNRGDWPWILTGLGWPAPVIGALRDWHVLPEAFLYGFAFVLQFARERGAFLNGEHRLTGWVSFFPYAFLVKTTLPLLGLVLLGAVQSMQAGWRSWHTSGPAAWGARLRPFTPLAALFAVYWATSLASHLNIGHRHILPVYPVLFIAAGVLGAWLDFRRPLAALFLSALVLWHVGESFWIRPHYLAYFNALAGGPINGHRHLVDSSLDWGQDLPGLKTWLDQQPPGAPVYLSYFGSGEPGYYGIRARRLPFVNGFKIPQPWEKLEPGVYCIGATMLEHVYSPIRGPWTPELEKEYQWMRSFEPAFEIYRHDPLRRAAMDREASPEKWKRAWTRHDLLRFARLCHYLRVRRPDAQVGYSIFIYRLSAAEIAAATEGSLADWSALIERAASANGR